MAKTSQKWTASLFEFDDDGQVLDPETEPQSLDECLALAESLKSGELAGSGDDGDHFQLQYDAENAAILYLTPTGQMLRPQFLGRDRSGDGIELFYCHCCGVQLGETAEMLAECTSREEGFQFARTIIDGCLPESESLKWVPLKPRREGS